MNSCKICNKEFEKVTSKKYCSDECKQISKKKAMIELNISRKIKRDEIKSTWTIQNITIDEVKNNREVPINTLPISTSMKTHLKFLLRNENLTMYKKVKMKRCDGINKEFDVVVITPKIIKKLFDLKYEVYKNNFRQDSLKTAKTIKRIYDQINV